MFVLLAISEMLLWTTRCNCIWFKVFACVYNLYMCLFLSLSVLYFILLVYLRNE